jgi:hypothetical protein
VRRELTYLAWLTLVFVGILTLLVVSISWVSNSTAAGGRFGELILLVVFFLLALLCSTLTALNLGITGCRAARQQQHWGWFVSFLALTVLGVVGVLSFFLESFLEPFGLLPVRLPAASVPSVAVALSLLIGPPLALVSAIFIFRSASVVSEDDQTFPASSGE